MISFTFALSFFYYLHFLFLFSPVLFHFYAYFHYFFTLSDLNISFSLFFFFFFLLSFSLFLSGAPSSFLSFFLSLLLSLLFLFFFFFFSSSPSLYFRSFFLYLLLSFLFTCKRILEVCGGIVLSLFRECLQLAELFCSTVNETNISEKSYTPHSFCFS